MSAYDQAVLRESIETIAECADKLNQTFRELKELADHVAQQQSEAAVALLQASFAKLDYSRTQQAEHERSKMLTYDSHEIEMRLVKQWMNSPEGKEQIERERLDAQYQSELENRGEVND